MQTNPWLWLPLGIAALVPAAARAEGEAGSGPCDEVTTSLREALSGPAPVVVLDQPPNHRHRVGALEDDLRSTAPDMPAAYIARVTPACRAETRAGAVPEATAAARAWTQRFDSRWTNRGRILLCTMQDPASLAEVATWMADPFAPDVRAVCASALATWPAAESVRAPIFARALRRHPGNWPENWEVDEAVIAAADTLGPPELRDQLLPVLASAHAHKAEGYDQLRAAVCVDEEGMTNARTRACTTLPERAEGDWRAQRKRRDLWAVRIAGPVSYGTIVTIAYIDRDRENGRKLATVGGGISGALVGSFSGALAGNLVGRVVCRVRQSPSTDCPWLGAYAGAFAGTIAGAVVGGTAAKSASPEYRTAITAVGFSPFLLLAAATF